MAHDSASPEALALGFERLVVQRGRGSHRRPKSQQTLKGKGRSEVLHRPRQLGLKTELGPQSSSCRSPEATAAQQSCMLCIALRGLST